MRPRDLSSGELVIVGDVRRRVATPVFELHSEAHPELLDVEV
jgi:hypothetical protein